MSNYPSYEDHLPPNVGVWLIEGRDVRSRRLTWTRAVPSECASLVTWLMAGYTRLVSSSSLTTRQYTVGPRLRGILSQVIPVSLLPDDRALTIEFSWTEAGDPVASDSAPLAGVPPDLGVWILDFQRPGSNRIMQSVAVPNSHAERLSCLMIGYTRVSRAHEMVRGGYSISPALSRLLRSLLPVEVPGAGGGYLYIGQKVDGDP